MSIYFIGLGNPGEEYEKTRHNSGRIVLEVFRKMNDFPEWEFDKKNNALISSKKIGKETVDLILPETFMNKSGESLKKIINGPKKIAHTVVLHDDLDLGLGKVKMSFNKGSAGHKGVISIVKTLKTEAFYRIRIGITPTNTKGIPKKPSGEGAILDFIVGQFKDKELEEIKRLAKKISSALYVFADESSGKAMTLCNTDNK